MHGIIFAELKKFAIEGFGPDIWDALLKEAGLQGKFYLATSAYPDEDAVALVMAASRLSGKAVPELLEAFGEFIVPDLVKTYGAMIRPDWKTLDLLEHTEEAIHKVIRRKDPNAAPPALKVVRKGDTEAEVTYSSPRGLFPIAQGIVKGVAKHYGETVSMDVVQEGQKAGDTWVMAVKLAG